MSVVRVYTYIHVYLGPLSEHSQESDQAATHRRNKTPNLFVNSLLVISA